MPTRLLPLFPLEVVLLPQSPLPLHIFEDRYKEMVDEALRDGTEFGVVLARDRQLAETGCTAAIVKVLERYPDGRLDILTSGRRRFEIVRVDAERPFLRAEVSFFDDDDSDPPATELVDEARQSYEEHCELTDQSATEVTVEEPRVSFLFAQVVQDLDFRQYLIAMRSEEERLRRLVDYLRDYNAKARLLQDARRLASRNGHGLRRPTP